MKISTINQSLKFTHLKKVLFALCILLSISGGTLSAQTTSGEAYGNTLNLGVGVGYYGYVGRSTPALHLNYELDVARNFTLAPFISFYSYQKDYYNGKNYYYRQTVIPVGVKGSFYLDQLLKANSKWDFYIAGSLGFAIVKTTWENGYTGGTNVSKGPSPLYLDLHLGTEYHINSKTGIFLDLSSGMSTIGLSFHK